MLRGGEELDLATSPSIILVIGVNGVGKTTTIGKLANALSKEGKKVILAAADTFRAAAIEQLEIWADRSKCEIIKQKEGSDPAAVIYDAISAAKARHADVIICDTAGRLHNKKHLMDELAKINRVIDRELPDASKEKLLVLDATTGQNAVNQAEQFRQATGITGIVLTDRIVISTSGWFEDRVVALAKKFPNIGIRISIEGLSGKNDELRGHAGGFDKGLRTLLTLKEMGLKDIGFGCTVSNNNSKDMLSLYQLSKSLGMEFATATFHNSYYFHKEDNVITNKNEVCGDFTSSIFTSIASAATHLSLKMLYHIFLYYVFLYLLHL